MKRAGATRLALAVLAVVGGCRTSTGADSRGEVAGTYVLESVVGRGPAAGQLVLGPLGRAERRVTTAGTTPVTFVATGTFRLRGNATIELALREQSAASYVWRVWGTRTADRIILTYPDPGDGEVVETYRRN